MSRFCITKRQESSNRFKQLSSKYNVSNEDLKTGIYAWDNTYNKSVPLDPDFLDSAEVEEFLDNYFKLNKVGLKGREYKYYKEKWDSLTEGRVIYRDKEKANKNYETCKKLFGEYNVRMVTTRKGNYLIRVSEPILDTSSSSKKSSTSSTTTTFSWGRTSTNSYEVSTQGDKRFSALNAKFKKGTIIDGVAVGGKTIEWVYQNVIKKSGKGKASAKDSKLYRNKETVNPEFFGVDVNGNTNEKIEETKTEITTKLGNIINIRPLTKKESQEENGLGSDAIIEFSNGESIELSFLAGSMALNGEKAYSMFKALGREIDNPYHKGEKTINTKNSNIIYFAALGLAYEYFVENPEKLRKLNLGENPLVSLNKELRGEKYDSSKDNIAQNTKTPFINLSEEELEDISYHEGYLPLWQEWAKQNPELIEELRTKASGKTLTDQYANTRVSQARALADILNSSSNNSSRSLKKSKQEKALEVVERLKENARKRIHFDETHHTYRIYESEEDKKADTKKNRGELAISVSKTLYGNINIDLGGWGKPASHLGNTGDEVTRDFFAGKLKRNYPNLTKKQLDALVEDLKILKNHFAKKYGKDYIVITEEFPIAARKSDGSYIAGTMDMLIIDSEGNIHILDMKVKRSGMSESDTKNYGDQTSIYQSILETYITEEDDVQVKGRELIHFHATYPAPHKYENGNRIDTGIIYTSEKRDSKTDQLFVESDENEREPIQNGNIEDHNGVKYNGIRLALTEGAVSEGRKTDNTLVNVENQNYDISLKSIFLTEEENEEEAQEPLEGENEESSSIKFNETKLRDQKNTLYGSGLLTPSEISFLANQAMRYVSDIISHLQNSLQASKDYFGSMYDHLEFTTMSRREIIDIVKIENLLEIVKEKYYNVNNRGDLLELEDVDIDLICDKYDLAYNNFYALMEVGYAKLIALEGVSLETTKIEDIILSLGDESITEDNDSGSLEEKEREYWQLGQRHISAKSNLSASIRRSFEHLKVRDKDGNPVRDSFGFNMETYVDSDTAVNNILMWVNNCTSIEEMESILQSKAESYPYLYAILDKIKEEPFRSQFFQNFRKDFTTYSIIRVQQKEDGTKEFVVQIINTKGAHQTMMSNIVAAFNTGLMPNLIITQDEIEGKGRVNKDKLKEFQDKYKKITEEFDGLFNNSRNNRKEKQFKSIITDLTSLLNSLGIQVSEKSVSDTLKPDLKKHTKGSTTLSNILQNTNYLLKALETNKNRKDYNPISKDSESGNSIYSNYSNIIKYLADNIESNIESSCYQNGKMYYSFVTPSYMGKLINNLKDSLGDKDKFSKFLEENYKKYRWFYESNQKRGDQYNNEWLRMLATDPESRRIFDHKVQLSYNNTNYSDLSELSYTLSLMHEFFSDSTEKTAWYRVPILSNKPSSEFIRFRRYAGDNYKNEIKKGLKKVFNQEILRIITVLERANVEGIEKIGVKDKVTFDIQDKVFKNNPGLKKKLPRVGKNGKLVKGNLTFKDIIKDGKFIFEGSGASFKFLEVFNKELVEGTELGQLILDKINGKDVDEATLDNLLMGKSEKKGIIRIPKKGAFDKYMDAIVENEIKQWESIGLFETEQKGKNKVFKYVHQFGKNREELEHNLENYIWNDLFATINIIQLTATDLAYYKNMEDFQKRYAQVHSPTLRLNTTAEWEGVRVSKDGISRTVYLSDFNIQSDIIPHIKEIFRKKIESIDDPTEKANMKRMAELIFQDFKKINVADAQGYSSPTSYRKKMVQAGRWDDTMEEAYERIRNGNFNVNDLGVVWQPLKPFVYSQISKTSGASTMSTLKVPVQNKNSEYLLLMADALLRSGNKTSKLTAIFDFMEDSAYDGRNLKKGKTGIYNGIGIDTVQFISAVNSGAMGAIDINEFDNSGKTPTQIVKAIKNKLNSLVYYNEDKSAPEENDYSRYNDQYVHEIPFEDYGIQQEVPAHFADHEQLMGSQIRILSISDISDNAKFKINNYTHLMDKDPLIERYQKLIADNIKESFDILMKDLGINRREKESKNDHRKRKNRALSKLLIESIKKDQRYGADLIRACSLDKNDEFIIPLSDPIQSLRIQQLLNSIIKSRINKQKIKGGPVVQASVFGMSDDLNIIFVDKDGNELRKKKANETDAQYQAYLEKHQASLKGVEVYMPIPSKEMEEALTKPDGTLMDVKEAVEKGIINPEMLKAIGYRIPTEDKYSMMPMIIKGFLPKAAGEAIMMPKEITLITGSDFDIDKMYIMTKAFHVKRDEESLKRAVIAEAKKTYGKSYKNNRDAIDIAVSQLIQGQELENNEVDNKVKEIYEKISLKYKPITFTEYNTSKGDEANHNSRNNEIFDIQWAVLTHQDTLDKMFNPGSFKTQKKSALIINLLKSGSKKTYEELSKLTVEDLEKEAELSTTRNIILSSTQVYFHKQNMTAGKLIGIFANNNTSHAFCSLHHIHWMMQEYAKNGKPTNSGFYLGSHKVDENNNNSLDPLHGFDGTLISKNIAGFLAASVDAVKDPVLSYMNINTITAGPAMVLARLGFDSDTIGLLMSQPIIENLCKEYFKRSNESYVTINDVIEEVLNNNFKEGHDSEAIRKKLLQYDLSNEILAEGIRKGTTNSENQLLALHLFQKLSNMSHNLNTLTFLTKFNSTTNSPGPNISDTLTMRERYDKFVDLMKSDIPPFSNGAQNIISNTPILKAFFESTIGVGGASQKIFEDYFPHYSNTIGRLLSRVRSTTKADLDSKTINKLINDFIFYKLTLRLNDSDVPIINTSEGQRYKFIREFPKKFLTRARELNVLDNDLIKIISLDIASKKCRIPVLGARTGGYSIDTQEKIKNAWSDLMLNEKTFELGRDLFIYNMYRSGFTFSPKTFLHLASSDTKLAMGKYIETIMDPTFYDEYVEDRLDDFILQFKRNNPTNTKLIPELKKNKNIGIKSLTSPTGKKQLEITFNNKTKQGLNNIITDPEKKAIASVIRFDDKLYYINDTSIERNTGTVYYEEISPLGNTNNFLEYDANTDALSMRSVLSLPRTTKKEIEKIEDSDKEKDSSGGTEVTPKAPSNGFNLRREDLKTVLESVEDLYTEHPEYVEQIKLILEGYDKSSRYNSKMVDIINETIKDANEQGKVYDKLNELQDKFCR